MPKNNVIFTGLFIVSTMILPFSQAHGKTVSINGQTPESITKVKISTNSLNSFQPNAVMMWTEKRKESPVKIYATSGNEALALREAILTGTQINCKLRLADTCSSYEIIDKLTISSNDDSGTTTL